MVLNTDPWIRNPAPWPVGHWSQRRSYQNCRKIYLYLPIYNYIYLSIYINNTNTIFITIELPSNKLRNLVQFLRRTKMLKALSNNLAWYKMQCSKKFSSKNYKKSVFQGKLEIWYYIYISIYLYLYLSIYIYIYSLWQISNL